jgi:hypothetical protein
VRWTLLIGTAAAGVVLWAAHRRTRQDDVDADLWAEATDPVLPA